MRYFAYGSNMDPRRMAEVCPGAVALDHGRLPGYRLEFSARARRWEGGAANLAPDPDGHVWGVVWEVGEGHLRALDEVAGHPDHFRRQSVKVELGGEPTECETYLVPDAEGMVAPVDRYLAAVRAAMRLQGLPPEAIDALDRAAEAAGAE